MSGEFFGSSAVHDDDIERRAARAAEEIVTGFELPAVEKSQAELEYDKLREAIVAASDKGIDAVVAARQLDPDGRIQRAYDIEQHAQEAIRDAEQRAEQDALNHKHVDSIHETLRAQRLAVIDKIADPVERSRARNEFMARERAAESRRGRRW